VSFCENTHTIFTSQSSPPPQITPAINEIGEQIQSRPPPNKITTHGFRVSCDEIEMH
nr:hypothetical protein [Tanacetum cinerariifolium]